MASPPGIGIATKLDAAIDALPQAVWDCLRTALRHVREGRIQLRPYPGRPHRYFFRACECLVVLTWPSVQAKAVVVRLQPEYQLPSYWRDW